MMERVEPSGCAGRLAKLQRVVERPLLRMHAKLGMANDPCLLLLAKLASTLIKTLFVEEEEEEQLQQHQEELRFAVVAERSLLPLEPC